MKSIWILNWRNGSKSKMIGDKFYKSFLEEYKISDLKNLKYKEWIGTIKLY